MFTAHGVIFQRTVVWMCGQNETVSHAQLNYAQNHWMCLFAASFLDSWHDPLFINVHSYETVISDLNIFEKKNKKHPAQIQI